MGITYKDSGVDIEKADRFLEKIKKDVKSTRTKGVIGDIGGFGGFFRPDLKGMKDPVLVSSTDGVGTKLIIARMMDIHDTVGIDLVGMVVNDIAVNGAVPLFFLDYIATGKLDVNVTADVVSGIARGCIEAECALIGGETAEMPDFYSPGTYDLAGFGVGIVDRNSIIDGSAVKNGDLILGIPSSGLHSNGYSLARKIVFDILKMKVGDYVEDLRKKIGEELLLPTRIYIKTIKALLGKVNIAAIAHITGGGLVDNIGRLLPAGLGAEIDVRNWDPPPIFKFLKGAGKIEETEMMRTFNNGIGLAIIADINAANKAQKILSGIGEKSSIIGEIKKIKEGDEAVSFLSI